MKSVCTITQVELLVALSDHLAKNYPGLKDHRCAIEEIEIDGKNLTEDSTLSMSFILQPNDDLREYIQDKEERRKQKAAQD